ncbi:M48 family metallopeptidase [Candidatus Deianiraea vastatrix]|uniref:WLM domain metal-dependent hydrolase n=1 Tax=Candidatus Deianiraea vastatrix TaxID=2163644 RepID=A0A5B8XIY7_9RICK|nr:SprT family zinc-dependent metalloprotease [Candidatus Deianiraea vastatrix]QED23854.1 Putative WLM domain metal-dependent hydrolase [Candidatus Deianiraea vastatrix]
MEIKYIKTKRRSVSIKVCQNLDVVVRFGHRISQDFVENFINQKRPWIQKQIDKIKAKTIFDISKIKYEDGTIFPYLGRDLVIKIFPTSGKDCILENGENLEIYTKKVSYQLIKKLFEKNAIEIFNEKIRQCLAIFETIKPINKDISLKIRKMKSRYGSMSTSGVMTLNLSLIHYDLEIIKYVIMHELCHVFHMNHGRGFYNLLLLVMPNFREIEARLKGYKYKFV